MIAGEYPPNWEDWVLYRLGWVLIGGGLAVAGAVLLAIQLAGGGR